MLHLLRDDQKFADYFQGLNPDTDSVLDEVSNNYEGLWRSPGALYRVIEGNKFECIEVDNTQKDIHWLGQIAMIIHELPGINGFARASQAFLNYRHSSGAKVSWKPIYVELEKNRIVKHFPESLLNDTTVHCRYGRIEILERITEEQPRH